MKKVLLSLIAVMLVGIPASAQFYPDGRPIPPSKRGGYRYAHRVNRYRDRGNCQYADTYYGFRMGFGIGTVNSDTLLQSLCFLRVGCIIQKKAGRARSMVASLRMDWII